MAASAASRRARRLLAHLAPPLAPSGASDVGYAEAGGDWGASAGFPSSPAGSWLTDEQHFRVGNYSGGYEATFPHHTIKAAGETHAAARS